MRKEVFGWGKGEEEMGGREEGSSEVKKRDVFWQKGARFISLQEGTFQETVLTKGCRPSCV